MPPALSSIDHLVLTVASIERTIGFYARALGMTAKSFAAADGTTRWALYFGPHKINLHQAGQEFEPKAAKATAGSADLCFLTSTPLDEWTSHLRDQHIDIVQGPVARSGATGPILSIYLRDPDGNLLEISVPD